MDMMEELDSLTRATRRRAFELPSRFDQLIHQPSRLAIMAVLAGCEHADFTYLVELTGLNKGTLSKHLSKLRDAGYVQVVKRFSGNYPNTSAKLTADGLNAFAEYRKQSARFNRMLEE